MSVKVISDTILKSVKNIFLLVINTRYHFIRECIARKKVQIKNLKLQDQAAVIFTKLLKQEDFEGRQPLDGNKREDARPRKLEGSGSSTLASHG